MGERMHILTSHDSVWGPSYEKFWVDKNSKLLKSGTHSGGATVSTGLFKGAIRENREVGGRAEPF